MKLIWLEQNSLQSETFCSTNVWKQQKQKAMTRQVVCLPFLALTDTDVRLPPGGYFSTSESSCSCREASYRNGREQQRGREREKQSVIDSQQPPGVTGG